MVLKTMADVRLSYYGSSHSLFSLVAVAAAADNLYGAMSRARGVEHVRLVDLYKTAGGSSVADVLRDLGEAQGFDPRTCDDVAAQPFDEALQAAYGYLAQAGLDPDELLAAFISTHPDIATLSY